MSKLLKGKIVIGHQELYIYFILYSLGQYMDRFECEDFGQKKVLTKKIEITKDMS